MPAILACLNLLRVLGATTVVVTFRKSLDICALADSNLIGWHHIQICVECVSDQYVAKFNRMREALKPTVPSIPLICHLTIAHVRTHYLHMVYAFLDILRKEYFRRHKLQTCRPTGAYTMTIIGWHGGLTT